MKSNTPSKPQEQKDQISMLWDAVYNHIPARLKWQDVKLNFILGFMALILVVLGVLATLIVLS